MHEKRVDKARQPRELKLTASQSAGLYRRAVVIRLRPSRGAAGEADVRRPSLRTVFIENLHEVVRAPIERNRKRRRPDRARRHLRLVVARDEARNADSVGLEAPFEE